MKKSLFDFGKFSDKIKLPNESITYRPYIGLTDLSDPTSSSDKLKTHVSLATNAIYATALEALETGGIGEAILLVPVPQKKLKKALKKHPVYTELHNAYDIDGFAERADEKTKSLPELSVSIFNVDNLNISLDSVGKKITQNVLVSFVVIPDLEDEKLINYLDTLVPDEFKAEKTKEALIIGMLFDIAKKMNKTIVSIPIAYRDKIFASDDETFLRYVSAIKSATELDSVQKYLSDIYINAGVEAYYSAMCK